MTTAKMPNLRAKSTTNAKNYKQESAVTGHRAKPLDKTNPVPYGNAASKVTGLRAKSVAANK